MLKFSSSGSMPYVGARRSAATVELSLNVDRCATVAGVLIPLRASPLAGNSTCWEQSLSYLNSARYCVKMMHSINSDAENLQSAS